jgi:transposase InsO family protein
MRTRQCQIPFFASTMDFEYTSNEFREMLRLSQFSQSMGGVGDSYDNAMAEALWASLKGARISNSL